ncbi:MAG: NAD(P)H-dependent oxidoreductase [Clostridiales bacterium]|nr:NAD(P)H-dependent oxidoreductase [Clostridiales bacterium]
MAKKTLVAYFSASGVTAALAKRLADAIGADLHEIQPEVPYTKEDLDWTNKSSRSSVEMNDKSFRPPIANRVENISDYDTIYIGFPIWWYVAPTIINTFLEQYDLTGKEIIPFATSGSSGMGRTNEELKASCKGAVLKEGRRFAANADAAELKAWADKSLSK